MADQGRKYKVAYFYCDKNSIRRGEKMEAINMKSIVAQAANRWGDNVALIIDEFEERLTFSDLEYQSNAIANMLHSIGVEYGDNVAVMLQNRAEFPLTWLALSKIGAVMVPINVQYKEYDTSKIIAHSGAKVIITSNAYLPIITSIQGSVSTLETIMNVDRMGKSDQSILDYHHLVSLESTKQPKVSVFPESLVNIQYTSGTTGNPKGCMLTHEYWLTLAKQFTGSPVNIDENDVMLTAQPFYYMDPQWNFLTAIKSGARLIMLDRFHPSTFMKKVRSYDVSFFSCVGVMPTLLLKTPLSVEDRNNKLRYVACSAIPKEIHKEIEDRWGVPWHEMYGATEVGGVTFIPPHYHGKITGSGTIGCIDKHKEALIVDETDRPVPRGEVGELVIRGLGIMKGYFKDQKATNKVFQGGWFHTGDLVRMDDEGLLYFQGRKKDVIRRSGENISASEVEDVIKLHESVQNVACIPVPDDIRGEEIKAYIVLKPGFTPESVPPKELINLCDQMLAYFKIPRYWEYRSKLPLTASERVAKHILVKEKEDLVTGSYDSAKKLPVN